MATEAGKIDNGGRPATRRRVATGVVTSDAADKTVVVTVQHTAQHPLYKKVVRSSKKLMAHDENNECRVGDRVRVAECRPLSRRKRWRVLDIVEKAPGSREEGP